MSRLAQILPFATPEEEGLERVSRPAYVVTTRSRIDDMERQAQLESELDDAPTPDEQERILGALDALRAEQEADERRAQEEADAKYDEENSKW